MRALILSDALRGACAVPGEDAVEVCPRCAAGIESAPMIESRA